jgi:hypothetical protein
LLDGRGCGRAAAGRALIVNDLTETAVLEEDVLAGHEAIAGVREGVGERENRCRGAGVFDAGVAVGRDAEAEVVVAGVFDVEADVGREDDVLWSGVGVELDRAAVEAEEQ